MQLRQFLQFIDTSISSASSISACTFKHSSNRWNSFCFASYSIRLFLLSYKVTEQCRNPLHFPGIPTRYFLTGKKVPHGKISHKLNDLIPYNIRFLAVLFDMRYHKLVNPGTLTFRVPAGSQKTDFGVRSGPEAHPIKPGIRFSILL